MDETFKLLFDAADSEKQEAAKPIDTPSGKSLIQALGDDTPPPPDEKEKKPDAPAPEAK